MREKITIDYSEYEDLLKDKAILEVLFSHDVENWQGFEKAIDSLNRTQ